MKDISELPKAFNDYLANLKLKLIDKQQKVTEEMSEDARNRIEIPQEARNTSQFIKYRNSIQTKEAELEEDEIKSSVYSDLKVGGDDPRWADVPVGAFLEWGTGPLGKGSNTYPHGYDYTTLAPWDYHTWLQLQQTGTWGITARPHLYPAFVETKPKFQNNVKEAIKEAWKQ